MKHPVVIDSRGQISDYKSGSYKAGIISKYISTQLGRKKLAAAMVNPLRTTLDYQSIRRKTFIVDQLPTGCLPSYDKGITSSNFKHNKIVINSRGEIGKRGSLNIRKIKFPSFEIFENPTIKLSDIKTRRFNLLDRVIQKAKQEIMSQEDDDIFNTLKKYSEEK